MSRPNRRRITPQRAAAMLAAVLTVLLTGVVALPAPAYAETYGVSVYASPSSTTTGNSITWVATNDSSGSAWVTLCSSWGGSLLAQAYVPAGGSLTHAVTEDTAMSETLVALVPHESSCSESYDAAATGTWTSPTSTTTTTTTVPAATYSVSASAQYANPAIDTEDLITGTNTASQSEHISLCLYGGASPIAEGIHSPGSSLTHDVTSSTAGSKIYELFAGPSYGCSGTESNVTVDWKAAATVSVSPTAAGTTSGVANSTSISWDGAATGDRLVVVETNRDGTAENVTKSSSALSSFSGSTSFSATETTSDGTQWVNDYVAELRNSSGTTIAKEDFSFTWSGTSCTSDQVGLSKSSSTTLLASAQSPVCLPKGTDSLEVFWSSTQPSAGGTIPLLTEVGGCTLGTGPTTVGTMTCSVTPAAPHNSGWYEAYIIEDLNGSQVVVACSGNVELSVAPTNTYSLDLSASNATPTVGDSITLFAANTSSNPEWLNICGTSGTTDQAAGDKSPDESISHAETSSVAGTVTYIAYASGSEACSGTEARVSVTWEPKPSSTSTTPALSMAASDYTPTVGQNVTLTLSNTSSASEWLDYCATSGTALTAAGTHSPGGSLTTTVSASSPGEVTYVGWAGAAEGCSTVKQTVTVDWQAAVSSTSGSATTTTTTTVPPSGTTTTTVPPSVPPSGTTGTVVVGGSGSSGVAYYPTDIHWPVTWPSPTPGNPPDVIRHPDAGIVTSDAGNPRHPPPIRYQEAPMFPTRPPTKSRVRRLTATAAGALLAVAGMTGLGVASAAPAHAASLRNAPVMYEPLCDDLEISGQTYPAYPIACTAPTFPQPWNVGPGVHTQSTVVTLRNTSGVTVGLTPRDFAIDGGHSGGIAETITIPVRDLPPGRSEQVGWKVTLYGPYPVLTAGPKNAPFPSIDLGGGADIAGVGTDPNAGVGWSAFYPVIGTPTYALSATASPSSPRTGQASTITATNTSKVSEHLALCGGGKMLAAGIHPPGGRLVHAVRRSTAGTETFTVVAGARYACSGSPSKTFTVDWTGTAPPASTAGMSVAVAGDGGEPVGHPDRLFVADTGPRGAPAEWLTMCVDGRPVASGLHAPGTVLVHAVTGPSVGSTVTVDAYADASPGACSGVERTFTVTGLSAGPTVTVTNLHAFASAASATVGAKVQTWVTDTATGPTWATLCQAGRPIASAWLHPGQGMPHAVAAATAGSVTYAAMQGKASCSSGDESSVTVTWTAAS